MAVNNRVGPYRILRLVNRGGQGSVYLGYDDRLRRRVAIKIYPLPIERVARKQLLKEARVLAGIQSPKIVQIYDVVESPDHLAMVMEYVPGCDLEEFLLAVRPSLASIITVCADLAAALTVARQHRIVHGDLKAANVLISSEGRVKLTDFGIARSVDGTGAVAGSLSSISPEQYQGKPLTERSDLFSLGCLLYRMICGVQPFYKDGQLNGRALLEEAPLSPVELAPAGSELPSELVELAISLLQKLPNERPSSTRVVRQTLRRLARTIPLAASASLLEEAQPCFRLEDPEDIPLNIPATLGREGRSTIALGGSKSRGLRRTLSVVGVCSLVLALSLFALTRGKTEVYIEAPLVQKAPGVELPGEISGLWLAEVAIAAVSEYLGPLQVSGPVGATPVTTFYSNPALRKPRQPTESLQLAVRCEETLCVYTVSRHHEGQQSHGQAILFPDMSERQWSEIVRDTTQKLYE